MRGSEYAELAAFAMVATEGNFRRAAKRLGMSPSALSRTIRSLEDRLGARLLNRTTRSTALTEAGEALLDGIEPALAGIEQAVRQAAARDGQTRGRLRINLPRIAARRVVEPRLGAFAAAYPAVQLDLVIDDEVTDVVAAGFDAGVRLGGMVQKDMVAVRLTADVAMAVVGAPGYFAGRAVPRHPEELVAHRCVSYRFATGVLQRWWFAGEAGAFEVAVSGAMTANDTDTLLAAAMAGVGLAYLGEPLVVDRVREGTLVRVLDAWCRPSGGFHLYYPDRRHMPAALRAFVDFYSWRAR